MPNGCIEWRGHVGPNGYGHVECEGRSRSAHRVAFALSRGPIPEGMLVCHTCDNRICVNPAHMWLGTHQDNSRDARKKGRLARNKATVKPKGMMTETTVAQARAEYDAGVRLRLIAKKHGMSYHGMRGVVLRLTWKHVVP